MQTQEYIVQITFYYNDGRIESFHIRPIGESIEADINQWISKSWCVLNTPDNTVFVNMANILKVEVTPAIGQFSGQDIPFDAQRLTPLTRGSRVL